MQSTHLRFIFLLLSMAAVLTPSSALAATVGGGGGVQPELELHYPAGFEPVNTTAAAATLTFPANFAGNDVTALIHTEHPRLFATSDDWRRLRHAIPANPYLSAAQDMILNGADRMLSEPPIERIIQGRRMLSVSREVLNRVLTLATAHQVTNDQRYFERARSELLNAATFADWNPSHFLDTAEMTMAFAIGYDWLYHKLSVEDRTILRQAILEKGLKPGSGPAEPGTITYWKLKDNNWVQSCFGGMLGGALAIAEDEPELAAKFLREMFKHIPQALNAYAPDGAYPEGPGYWTFGTHYSVMIVSMLHSSLGTSWNLDTYPGFQASAIYMNEVFGPNGIPFNYSDGSAKIEPNPALHWFAARARNAALDSRERRLLLSDSDSRRLNRFFPFTLLWLDPTLSENSAQAALPLNWMGRGLNPIATLRSSWEADAIFVGFKAGSPSNNHGHMDIGSFVLDWKGVRWSFDFGGQDYDSLEQLGMNIWGYKDQNSQRWDVFRISNLSHSTLAFDGDKQRVDGYAPITKFSDSKKSPFAVQDMSTVYRDSVSHAIRGIRLLEERAVLIHDEIDGLASDHSVRWGMLTHAEVALQGDRATLRQNGQTLHVRILQPTGANFEIVATDPPPRNYDEANPGTRMLATVIKGNGQPCNIRVVISDGDLAPTDVTQLLTLPSPSQWKSAKKHSD